MTEKIMTLNMTAEKTKGSKILLWSSLGPILIILALIVISLMKTTLSISLGILASLSLIGIFFFGLKGLLVGSLVKLAFLSYAFSSMEIKEGPFILLITLSFLLSHLIFLLGLREARSLVEMLECESKSRLNALWKLEEKARLEERNFQQERAKYLKESKGSEEGQEKVSALLIALDDKSKALEKISKEYEQLKKEKEGSQGKEQGECASLKQELEEAYRELEEREKEELRLKNMQEEMASHIERLLGEQEILTNALVKGEEAVIRKEEELLQLGKEVEKLSIQAKEQEAIYKALFEEGDRKAQAFQEKEFVLRGIVQETHAKNVQFEKEVQELKQQKEEMHILLQDKEALIKKFEECKEPSYPKEYEKKLEALVRERDKYKGIIAELKQSRKDDAKNLKEAQGQYKQLKQQFDEKSLSLDDSRKALFHMQEKLFLLQREADEHIPSRDKEMESILEEQVKKMEEERKEMLKEHQEEVESLQDVIEALSLKQSKS